MSTTNFIRRVLYFVSVSLLLSAAACEQNVRQDGDRNSGNFYPQKTKDIPRPPHTGTGTGYYPPAPDSYPANNNNFALLIGIGSYQNFPLDGPPYDLESLQAILPQWGFPLQNITILSEQQATHAGVMEALSAMEANAKPGNKILIYFSGHGTSAEDGSFGGKLPLPHTSGALVPIDFTVGDYDTMATLAKRLLVGRDDIRPILQRIDAKGAQVLTIFDSCYSGNSVRAFNTDMRERRIKLRTFGSYSFMDRRSDGGQTATRGGDTYPYRNVVHLGAALETQPAMDISRRGAASVTIDGNPHGAFTNGLLLVLNGQITADIDGDGTLSPAELHGAISPLVSNKYRQTPQILPTISEDAANTQQRGFFVPSLMQTAPAAPQPADNSSNTVLWAKLLVWIDPSVTTKSKVRGLERLVDQSKSISTADITLVRNANNEIEMVLPNGNPLARYATDDPKAIETAMEQQVRVWPLRKLHHANANFQVQIERGGDGADSIAVEGSLVGFSVRSTKDVYYLALDIDPEGKVTVLYPHDAAELARTPANQVVDLMDDIRVIPPFGTDYVKVFAFANLPPDFARWIKKAGIVPGDADFVDLACLVGLAIPGSGKTCPSDGVADATFTLSTYPTSEVQK